MNKTKINTKGEKNPNAKLNPETVEEIRILYQTGGYSLRKIAEKFNISHTHVRRIAYEIAWNTL